MISILTKPFCILFLAGLVNYSYIASQVNTESSKIKKLNIKSIDYIVINDGNASLYFDQDGRITELISSLNEDREEFFFDSAGNNIAYFKFRRFKTRMDTTATMVAHYDKTGLISQVYMDRVGMYPDSNGYSKKIIGDKIIENFGYRIYQTFQITDTLSNGKVIVHSGELSAKQDSAWSSSYFLSFDSKGQIESLSTFDHEDLQTPKANCFDCKIKNGILNCKCDYSGSKKIYSFEFKTLAEKRMNELTMLKYLENDYVLSPFGMMKKIQKQAGKDYIKITCF